MTTENGPLTLSKIQLAARIEHTILTPEASSAQVHRVATEAMQNGCAAVCVAPVWLARVATMLRGSGTAVVSVVSFPHGASKSTVKAIEATSIVKDGAAEVDVVAHLPLVANADVDALRAELLEITRAARAVRRDVVLKVILETAYLLSLGAERGEAAIAAGCRAARESGFDYVKTSSGFHPAGGASVEAVTLLKKHADGLKIKAAGGIRDLPFALALLEAGADRLGMSATMDVLGVSHQTSGSTPS